MSSTQLKSASPSVHPEETKIKRRQQRDSHHDWNSRQNKSIIAQQDLLLDIEYTCMDRFCRIFSKLPMLSPFGPFRLTWDVCVMFMLIYTSLEVPFTLGFGIDLQLHGKYVKFGYIALFIDICLLIDICFNFRTAFVDKYDDLRLITNAKRIAFRYIKGWFLLDLLTSFPFEFILSDDNGEGEKGGNFGEYVKVLRIFRLFRIFKILRLLKMVKLFDGFVSNVIAREVLMVIRLFKVLCFALLSAHMCACLWYYTGCNSHTKYDTSWIYSKEYTATECGIFGDDNTSSTTDSLYIRYSVSWYWSVVTLFTTGYGDIVATNPSEQWIASLVIFIGTCLFGYFVGTITSLIVEGDKVSSTIISKVEDAQHFCQQKQLPRDMARAVLTHTRYHCQQNYVLGDESDVLNCLPSYLAMDVSTYISRKYLENLDFLNSKFVDPYIRGLIALKMKSISCNKGYKLFVKGDMAEEIYIQRIGKSNHYIYDENNKNNKPIKKTIKRGDVIGEYSLIKKKRESTLICKTFSEFYVLDVGDVKEILEKHYGSQWRKKYDKIKDFIRQEYAKPIKSRKKRQCFLSQNPLLPSFKKNDNANTNSFTETNNNNTTTDFTTYNDEEEGQLGHCDWGNEKEIQEMNDLRDLERITNEVLNANKFDLNDNSIHFGLNALSKNATKIQKLTTDKNKQFLKKHIMSPLHGTANITMHATKSMLRGLTRQSSFLRDLEVTKDFHANQSSEDSTDDEQKYDNNIAMENDENENEHEKRETLKVAESIAVEMMIRHNELHENQNNETKDSDENYESDEIDESYDDDDSEYEEMDETNNALTDNISNKNKKNNNVRRKKKRKNHKTHH